jgi:hypothetical protein
MAIHEQASNIVSLRNAAVQAFLHVKSHLFQEIHACRPSSPLCTAWCRFSQRGCCHGDSGIQGESALL